MVILVDEAISITLEVAGLDKKAGRVESLHIDSV
jgi:hypothetical protein